MNHYGNRSMQETRTATISALLLSMLLATGTAYAAEPGGRIEGVVGDREISVEMDPNQSDWYGDGNSGGVSVLSRPIAPKDGFGRISIGFEGSDFRDGRFIDFEVDLGVAGSPGIVYRATLDDGLEVTLERIETHGELLHIEGRVRGTLIRQEVRSGKRDEGDFLEFELNFSARLGNHY